MDICHLAERELDPDEDVYLFTWSPNPKRMDFRPYKNYMQHIWLTFYGINQAWDKFCICPELNPESGAVHYHGWYTMKDYVKWFKVFKPRLNTLGFTKINLLKHKESKDEALAYYKKNFADTKEIMYPLPIPYSHINYKNVNLVIRNFLKKNMTINGKKLPLREKKSGVII